MPQTQMYKSSLMPRIRREMNEASTGSWISWRIIPGWWWPWACIAV